MNIPVVKFEKMTLEDNINTILDFNKNFTDFDKYLFKMFPELSNLNKNISKEEKIKHIKEVVTKKYNSNSLLLEEAVTRYQKNWDKHNDKYMSSLSEYLNTQWPESTKTIKTKIGFIPIFPRYLDHFAFSTNPYLQEPELIKVTAHEVLHFLWFKKWMELHPNTPRANFDSPYSIWKYSEMVTDSILNSKEMSNDYPINEKSYDYFYDIKDGDKLVMNELKKIYEKNDSIENKINKGYGYVLPFIRISGKGMTEQKKEI